jgi:glucose-1-phosphate cytidylyltransferase
MKTILLAGGLGTRISEETDDKPKPMVQIKGKPIIWHLMNIYAAQGFKDFVIALGYKAEVVEEWISESRDIPSDWNVKGVFTGFETQTGGRLSQCMRLYPGERMMASYGDGLANVDLNSLIEFHFRHGKLATLTAVRPPARFGYLHSNNGLVTHFGEKNQSDEGWINGGFFVLEPEVEKYVHSDDEPFETGALPRLVSGGTLMSYQHEGFWQPMDTLREKRDLEKFALENPPPWLNLRRR